MRNPYRPHLAELSAAVQALVNQQLTLREFRIVVGSLAPEELQIAGTVIALRSAAMEHPSRNMVFARRLCQAKANQGRCWS